MSTSAQQESTRQSDSKDAAIPARGTPEYEAYYYQQIEESVHRTAAIYPESSIAKGWLSLNPIQQRIIVSSFLPVRFDPNDIDIEVEDREELDTTITLDRTRKRPAALETTTRGSLLKSAILYSTISKQMSSPQ
uniref:Uncharacterized protein n=1 Tax=Psilocybe cubensis TaxID=181762 RepID=A0A8H7Y3H4_PSICU